MRKSEAEKIEKMVDDILISRSWHGREDAETIKQLIMVAETVKKMTEE